MSSDVNLLVGLSEPGDPPSLARFAREVAGVLGLEDLEWVGDPKCVLGDGKDFRAWLRFHPHDEEPHLSHPFWVDIATEKGSEPEVGRRLFQELADTGRFRVVLWLDGVCDRSTHLPCEDC